MTGNKKKKIKEVLKKTLVGAKKGYTEASRAISKHGPGVHAGLSRVAESIQSGLAGTPRMMPRDNRMTMGKRRPSHDVYLKIQKKGKSKLIRIPKRIPKGKIQRVDWANLGVDIS